MNEATKRTQKALLKQQYENFNASSSESLDSIFNRLQKLVSRLAILGVVTPPEDQNVKFLRSLPSEWDTHVMLLGFELSNMANGRISTNMALMGNLNSEVTDDYRQEVNTSSREVSTALPKVNTATPKDLEEPKRISQALESSMLKQCRRTSSVQTTKRNKFSNDLSMGNSPTFGITGPTEKEWHFLAVNDKYVHEILRKINNSKYNYDRIFDVPYGIQARYHVCSVCMFKGFSFFTKTSPSPLAAKEFLDTLKANNIRPWLISISCNAETTYCQLLQLKAEYVAVAAASSCDRSEVVIPHGSKTNCWISVKLVLNGFIIFEGRNLFVPQKLGFHTTTTNGHQYTMILIDNKELTIQSKNTPGKDYLQLRLM
ncbi:hypothetical protein Tco_1352267 [Tanacetum coccineum]